MSNILGRWVIGLTLLLPSGNQELKMPWRWVLGEAWSNVMGQSSDKLSGNIFSDSSKGSGPSDLLVCLPNETEEVDEVYARVVNGACPSVGQEQGMEIEEDPEEEPKPVVVPSWEYIVISSNSAGRNSPDVIKISSDSEVIIGVDENFIHVPTSVPVLQPTEPYAIDQIVPEVTLVINEDPFRFRSLVG